MSSRFNPDLRNAWACSAALLLSACATPPGGGMTTTPAAEAAPVAAPSTMDTPASTQIDLPAAKPSRSAQGFVYKGDGNLIGSPGPVAEPPSSGAAGDITLNFDSTPLAEVVRIIVGDYLGKSYVIEPGVDGVITLNSNRPLAREDLLPTLESLLQSSGATLVEQDDTIHIVALEEAAKSVVPSLGNGSAGSLSGFRSVIIPLKYVSATELAKLIQPYGVQTTIHESRNLIIVSGIERQIRQVQNLVRTFDVDWLRGMSVGLFPLDNTEADTMVDQLTAIFSTGEGEKLAGLVRLVALERLNAVLAVSPQSAYVDRIDQWIKRLDQAAEEGGTSLFVYYVQNSRARDLARVLNRIFFAAPTAGEAEADPYAAPDMLSTYRGEEEQEEEAIVAVEGRIAGGAPVRIIADEPNNALVVMGTKQDYAIIERALRQLDIEPLQVLIEASIVEIILNDDLRYGLEWLLRGRTDDYVGEGLLDFGLPGIDAITPGFSYVVRKADEARLALNALAEDSQINVLSSPSLMVLNNQTATIRVGDEVPIPTRQSVSNINPDAPTVNEIQYRSTGVLLAVTPRVNSNGTITMDIDQEVSNVNETTSSDIDAPSFLQRHISSTVSVRSNETVVLGGLIREQSATTESGIPFFYKIPVLGKLFGQTIRSTQRTELVVLITPRAIAKPIDTREITEEYRRKMLGLAPVLEKYGK